MPSCNDISLESILPIINTTNEAVMPNISPECTLLISNENDEAVTWDISSKKKKKFCLTKIDPLHPCPVINTLRPRQNGRHFTDNIFECIFFNENALISLKISLKFVPKVQIINIPALVQIMAWRRPGDKPFSEPMMVSLLTHICVTRPQWVNNYHTNLWMLKQ